MTLKIYTYNLFCSLIINLYRNNLLYIEWLDIESGDILMELLKIDKSVIEK